MMASTTYRVRVTDTSNSLPCAPFPSSNVVGHGNAVPLALKPGEVCLAQKQALEEALKAASAIQGLDAQ